MKKHNTNSQTAHSKALRSRTASQRNAELRAAGLLSQMSISGNTDEINRLKAGLKNVPGESNLSRCLFLLEFFEQHNK